MSDKKKNVNVLRIEGDHDKLMTIMQRFATLGVKFEYEDADEAERRKLSVPETQVNTKQRLDAVPPATLMAPNLVDPAAFPNDTYDKVQRTIQAAQGEFGINENRKEIAKKESERQMKQLEQYEKSHANVPADASKKEEKPAANKKDKAAESRKTK